MSSQEQTVEEFLCLLLDSSSLLATPWLTVYSLILLPKHFSFIFLCHLAAGAFAKVIPAGLLFQALSLDNVNWQRRRGHGHVAMTTSTVRELLQLQLLPSCPFLVVLSWNLSSKDNRVDFFSTLLRCKQINLRRSWRGMSVVCGGGHIWLLPERDMWTFWLVAALPPPEVIIKFRFLPLLVVAFPFRFFQLISYAQDILLCAAPLSLSFSLCILLASTLAFFAFRLSARLLFCFFLIPLFHCLSVHLH